MPLALDRHHPVGMAENSPAFQRWDRGESAPSPEGTDEGCNLDRPFGTYHSCRALPALKRWAILTCPAGIEKISPPRGAKARHADFP